MRQRHATPLVTVLLAALAAAPAVAEPAVAEPVVAEPIGAADRPHHAAVERVARDHIYTFGYDREGGMRADAGFHELILETNRANADDVEVLAWTNELGLDGKQWGVAAVVFRLGEETAIVFRGTDDGIDVLEHAEVLHTKRLHVGKHGFKRLAKTFDRWAEQYPDAIVAGHSLGGALAQRYAAAYPHAVKELVLFQSPGVEAAVVAQAAASEHRFPATLYITDRDPVHVLGEGFVGRPAVVLASLEGVPSVYETHTQPMLQPDDVTWLRGRGRQRGGWNDVSRAGIALRTIGAGEFAQQRDPLRVGARYAEEIALALKDEMVEAAYTVADAGKRTGTAIADAAVVVKDKTVEAAVVVGQKTKQAAVATADATKRAATATAEATRDATAATADATKRAASATRRFAVSSWGSVRDTTGSWRDRVAAW